MTNQLDRRHILVVGTGSIGERHVRCFLKTDRVDVSICEVNAALRDEIAGRHDVVAAYDGLESALGSDLDAVVICTPAQLHVSMATQVVRAKRHVLIEKPLGIDLEGVDVLCEAVNTHGVTAAMAYPMRCHPVLADMRNAILEGRFGAPLQLNVVYGQHFPTFRPAYRDIYFANRATGGGAVQDSLTHFLNAGEWFFGPITDLSFDAAHCVLEGVEVEDTVLGIARHGNVLASYVLNLHQAPSEAILTVICERGTVRFDYGRNLWLWMTTPDGEWTEVPSEALERDQLFELQARAFLDAIDGVSPPRCTLADGVQTLRAQLAVLSSIDKGERHRPVA